MSILLPWPAESTPLRAWSAVIVLTLAYILSFIDRLVLAVLIEPLKRDLLLTDVQIALLHGTAFERSRAALSPRAQARGDSSDPPGRQCR